MSYHPMLSLPRASRLLRSRLATPPERRLPYAQPYSRSFRTSSDRRHAQAHDTLPQTQREQHPPPPPPKPQQHHQHQHHQHYSQPTLPETDTITEVETQINTHPLTVSLRSDPSLHEHRPHATMSPTHRPHHLVSTALAGPGKLTVPPYFFRSKASSKNQPTTASPHLTGIFHIGASACGHPGIVHGGLLSVIFDEAFARCAAMSFPKGVGVTASLGVEYRSPAVPGKLYVLKAQTVKVEGRKAWVEGRLEMLVDEDGNSQEEMDVDVGEKIEKVKTVLVAEGKSLFIEPRVVQAGGSVYAD